MSQIFAIDLGSGYTRAGAVLDGVISIIPLKNEEKVMPSIVSFRNGKRLVGVDAKKNIPDNIIFDSCRIYRRDRSTPCFAEETDGFYKIRPSQKSEETELITRQESISILFDHVKQQYEKKTGSPAQKAVITISDFITQHHKKLILQAAQISGLKVSCLLPQSTAAAIFYNLNTQDKKDHTFMVFNFGAGSLSVSVFMKKNGHTVLVSSSGDTNLGGEDITGVLMFDLVKAFIEHFEQDLRGNKKNLMIVRESCEMGKIHLSNFFETKLNFDLIDEKSYNYKLKRNLMENIAQKIFLKIEGILAEALIPIKSASLTIDEVLLVGGSTRIPKIKEIIHKYIPNIQFNTSIVPEEAVVRGAAIKAAILAGNTDLEFADVNYAPMLPIYCAIKNSLVRMYVVRKLEMVPSPIGKEAALELPSSELPIEVFESGGDYLGSLLVQDNSFLTVTFKLDNHGLLQTWIIRYPHGIPEKVDLYNPNSPNKRPALLNQAELKKIHDKGMNALEKVKKMLNLETREKSEKREKEDVKSQDRENLALLETCGKPKSYAEAISKKREEMISDAMQENIPQTNLNHQPNKMDVKNNEAPTASASASIETPNDFKTIVQQHYESMAYQVENNLKNITGYERCQFILDCEKLQLDLKDECKIDHKVACQHMYNWYFNLKFKNDVLERISDARSLIQEKLGFMKAMNNEKFKEAGFKASEGIRSIPINFKANHIEQIQEEYAKFDTNVRISLFGEPILQDPQLNQLLQKPEPSV
uniref:Uncharacterized protein n=1 Tax=Acrobeloides nanus TaxID=290746 RepID=A0A914C3U6_9BILA